MSADEQPNMITLSAVISRPGWSKSVVIKLLGEPDLVKRSYQYKNTFYKLYDVERVQAAELTEEFSIYQEKLQRRKLGAQKAVLTKKEKLMNQIRDMQIKVDVHSLTSTIYGAIESYNENKMQHGYYDNLASFNSDKTFLDRIVVNYIRHELTSYDYALWEVVGKVGVEEAVNYIRERVYREIAKCYPAYKDECDRQYLTGRNK